jgi:hypothetical protein
MLMMTAWSAVIAIPTRSARAAEAHAEDIYALGDAPFYGSTGKLPLAQPIVGMDSSPSGRGYWSVASDGGIFSFGDARFFGSTGALRLNRPIVGMAATPSGRGYQFVASDGGIFSFGDARFHGSLSRVSLARPVTAMDATPSGDGYWLAAADGAVYAFGDARFFDSEGNFPLSPLQRVTAIVGSPTGQGYWLASARGPAANPNIEAAIAWYMSRVGQAVYTGECELAIENAFGTDSAYATASANWYARPVKHPDWQAAPRGALVFYDTSAAGHVAISLGDGRVVSTSVNGRIGIVATGYFQNPLGWTDSPFL